MKNKIKTLVFALALAFLLSGRATSQGMPVYDNTNFISLAKSLIESAKQTSQLLKTVTFLKEQKDNIIKVSNVIKQLQAVQRIANNNQELFNVIQNDLNQVLNSPYIKADEINRIASSFNTIVENSMNIVGFIDEILLNDNLKMSDGERAEILKNKERESEEMVAEINKKISRYQDIISFRKMQDKINNRETSY